MNYEQTLYDRCDKTTTPETQLINSVILEATADLKMNTDKHYSIWSKHILKVLLMIRG